ncbi:hypothetical protein GGR53DRAFT_272647 [Hypoxylon sp. FL1150]|nr:hypothetical protein GGR53DRAFT_272647 [Hypoxylon sp. FL1150]
MDDPWNWDVDRVVQELCSVNRSWIPPSSPLKFPPLEQLEASLREEEVDGHTLLTYDHEQLCTGLGFKILKHRATLKHAIGVFRSRSEQYRLDQKRGYSEFDTDDNQHHVIREGRHDGSPSQLASINTIASTLEDVDLDRGSKKMHRALTTPSPSNSYGHSQIRPVSAANDIESSTALSHAKKKRRLAPTIISTDIDANAPRHIPTEADIIMAPESHDIEANASRRNNSVGNLACAYLGKDAFTRFDIIGDYGFSGSLQSLEVNVVGRAAPAGRSLQVYQFAKRILHHRKPRKLHRMKPDMVLGANNPDHDDVLPLYGESDEEYDSETWDEVEAERLERENEQSFPGLSHDEVQSIIDISIQKFASDWKQRKYPKLIEKSHRFWADARKNGKDGMRRSLDKNRRHLEDLKARIANYTREIASHTWYSAAELNEETLILQQSVEDRELCSWTLGVITAPNEPEKSQSLPQRAVKKTRQSKPISAEEEILTSESEEDPDDFIIHDESELPGTPSIEMPLNIIEDDIDMQAQPDSSPSLRSPKTPPKPREHDVIDLITPEKNSLRAAEVEKRKPHISSHQPSTLDFSIDDLEPREQMIARELAKYDALYVSRVFTLARNMEPGQIWRDVVGHMLDQSEVNPKSGTSHAQNADRIRLGSSIFRLFEMYRDNVFYSLVLYKNMSHENRAARKTAAEQDLAQFDDFIHFLYRLSDRFEWQEEWIPTLKPGSEQERQRHVKEERQRKSPKRTTPGVPDRDIESDGSSSSYAEPTPSKRAGKKGLGVQATRIRDAEALRAAEKERTEMMARRRNEQRDKLQKLEASGVVGSQKDMIINLSKDDDKQGFIYVHPEIAQRIKEHQVEGVRFMWDQIVVSSMRQGCLLAHTMGLGKTMQIVTLLVTIAQAANSADPGISSQIPKNLKKSRTLIVCPPSLVNNWLDELLFWTPEDHQLGDFFKIESSASRETRTAHILNWSERGGVLIMGYHLFKKAIDEQELTEILTKGPNLVVADEAHEMRNPKSKLHIAAARFKTQRRIALTGTPLANNVQEYYSMINWIAPNYLSQHRDFTTEYANPIQEGLKPTASRNDFVKALKMLRVLKKEVAPKMQRVTIAVLKDDIPKKQEFVLTVPLTSLQRQAYETFVRYHRDQRTRATSLTSAHTLGIICGHPYIFTSKLKLLQNHDEEGAEGDDKIKTLLPAKLLSDELTLLNKEKDLNAISLSWKIVLLISILEECKKLGEPVVLFSQSVLILNYLEQVFRKKKYSISRLDGKTTVNSRQGMVKNFNKNSDNLFLVSTKAGGQGFNIVGANRVVIFDAKWNPQDEQQAVGRVYRLGQKKQVFVYRFVCGGTIEEQAFNLQIWKMQLASRIVDKKNPIKRSTGLDQSLQLPTEPEQHDIREHVGKDSVLDKILEKHSSGIRAVTMTNTFEEEELENAHLTPEDLAEADQMVVQNEARRLGKPIPTMGYTASIPGMSTGYQPSQLIQPPGFGSGPSPIPYRQPNSGMPWPSVENPAHRVASYGDAFSWAPTNEENIDIERSLVNGLVDQCGISIPIPTPIQVSTPHTQGQPPNPTVTRQDMVWENESAFSGEIARFFSKNATPTKVTQDVARLFSGNPTQATLEQDMGRKVARRISTALSGQQPEIRGRVRQAIIDAASSPRFVEGISRNLIPAERLAAMEPETISWQRTEWEGMTEEGWSAMIKSSGQSKMNPDHPQDALRSVHFTSRNDHRTGQHKSHRLDDQQALEAVYQRRKAKGSSHHKNPRLPSWAHKAINEARPTNESRSSSTSPSGSSPIANSQHPKAPFS